MHVQDVDTTGNTSPAGKSDYLTSYDFDGDLNGRNNWENTSRYPFVPAHPGLDVHRRPNGSPLNGGPDAAGDH